MHLCQLRSPRGGRLDGFYFCLSFRRVYFWAEKVKKNYARKYGPPQYFPRSMIGKAPLNGFWECPECLWSWVVMPWWLALCDLGGSWLGDHRFPHSACCFTHLTVWQCDFCVSVFSLFLVLSYQHLSSYNAITSPSSIITVTFHFAFLVRVFCLVVFVCILLLVVWFGCLLCFCNGIVTAAGLCTGPTPVRFCGPNQWRPFVCIKMSS